MAVPGTYERGQILDEEADEFANFDAITGHLRMSLNDLMTPLRMYGQSRYVDQAVEEAISLAYQYHLKLSGLDAQPYYFNRHHW